MKTERERDRARRTKRKKARVKERARKKERQKEQKRECEIQRESLQQVFDSRSKYARPLLILGAVSQKINFFYQEGWPTSNAVSR